jgi:putative addiction module component (TIGR02574 family)
MVVLMNKRINLDPILSLPVAERLEVVSQIWDSLVRTPEAVPMPDWHKHIIEQRLAEDDGDTGETWSDLRKRLEGGA